MTRHVGSILNAYREGDLTFAEAVDRLQDGEWVTVAPGKRVLVCGPPDDVERHVLFIKAHQNCQGSLVGYVNGLDRAATIVRAQLDTVLAGASVTTLSYEEVLEIAVRAIQQEWREAGGP